MAGLNFQTEAEVGVVPDADRAFDQRWIAEDTEQQQTHTHACFQDKVRGSGSSDSSSDSATSVQPVSPRTMYADPRTATTSSKPHDPSSVVDADADGFSPDLWVISPEERALVMVAAVVLHYPPLSSPYSVPPSPPRPIPPAYSRDSRHDDDDIVPASAVVPDVNRAPPRGRLQRSFTSSEREDAGVVIIPGFLRRLARQFSGLWQGPSSPLAPVSLVDTPPAGPLKRLRRVFSRRRRD
ncbi:hypothetical protein E4T44_08488 [Aureobasidium sp. EXF-8845]|nr:hypothetical protein E4T44_08488 [Aureobasidium sp. EXF-8845]KAI4843846.1 hypothetical protein E4T45_08411 [Aureobasidium sp. EXF-8846]